MRIILASILLSSLVLSSCSEKVSSATSFAPNFSQTPLPVKTDIPPVTTAITATPTINIKTIILTPDDIFPLSQFANWSTPNSEDFCEHLPSPQIVANPSNFSILSGKFVLCIYERIFTAMDLDTGSLVSTDDETGDIVLGSPGGSNENPNYGVFGWNNASLENAYVNEEWANHQGANNLSYQYCENALHEQSDSGGMYVGEYVGEIACVRTTKGRIGLLQVEKIYPGITYSVEFSFVILRNE